MGDIEIPAKISLRGMVNNRNWTDAEVAILRDVYTRAEYRGDISLDDLSSSLGRHRSSISKKARELGLSDATRPRRTKPKVSRRKFATSEELSVARSVAMKERHAIHIHPFAGKTHSREAREIISRKSLAASAAMTADQRAEISMKAMRTKVARYGSVAPNVSHGNWKAGWREIGGKRNYYRSRWEANYARYLEWLKGRGEIVDWKHEPETFWFEAIKRGVRSYLPDFRVWERDGSTPLHEVKGWMDARSKTTLKRMAKYHPGERIIVIRERAYNDIARKAGPMIDGWEQSERSDRW